MDKTDNRFKPLDWVPASWFGRYVEADDEGNRLFVFQDKHNNTHAVLEDQEGKRYDYSAFFETIKAHRIREVRGPDFQKQLILVGEHGFQLHVVKNESAILQAFKGLPIRAMVDLPKEEILVSTQAKQLFKFNKQTNTVTSWDSPNGRSPLNKRVMLQRNLQIEGNTILIKRPMVKL